MLDRAEVNVVSGAADVQQCIDPAPHPGRGAVAGVSHLLVPGTIHAGIIEELLLLKLPLSHRLDRYEAFLPLSLSSLRSGLVGQLEHEERKRQNIHAGQFPSTSFHQNF